MTAPAAVLSARGPYAVVYADPPWPYRTWSAKGQGRSASRHYRTLTLDEIRALPLGDLGADDAALLMWVTQPLLAEAPSVMEAWGFRYTSIGFVWVKTKPNVPALIYDGCDFHMGMGFYTRANAELCLLGTRRRKPRVLDRGVRQLVVAPRRQHSRKPEEVRRRIERLLPGPRVECFARERFPGWDVAFSDQADLFAARAA